MPRLITFGDSWTAGDCHDLIDHGIIPMDENVTFFVDGKTRIFKRPWPVVTASSLGFNLKNYATPGNCNKSIVAQLYDFHIFNKFQPTDIVVVLLSTWHRDYCWLEDHKFTYHSRYFDRSSVSYGPLRLELLGKPAIPSEEDRRKLAYNTFFDFYTAKNFLENCGVRYYIGWGFTNISDFEDYLNPEYVEEIVNTNALLRPFLDFCDVNAEKLFHPRLEEHKKYGKYIYNRIIDDGL